MSGAKHFTVSFDMVCDDPCAGDIKDALGEFFEKDVLEGKITNLLVRVDHAKEFDEAERKRKQEGGNG
jgi:hypothetical protein